MFKKFFIFSLSALLSSYLFAHSDLSLNERITQHGTIVIGTEGTYKPFTYHNAQGQLTGYDVEVARAMAKELGVKLEFKETEWSSMLAGLKAGRFDLVANQMSLTTPARRATFDKTAPYNFSGAMLVARKDDDRVKQLSDVKGLSSASALNSHYGELAQEFGAKLVPVDGMAMALKLIEQGRADITFNDALSLLDYLHQHPNANLKIVWISPEQRSVGFALNKGNDEALAKMNQAIETLRQNGTLKRLGIQFFGKDISVSHVE